jgi:thiaminase
MVAFTDRLIEANQAVWEAMAAHPFVLGLARGTLPDSALQAWVQQDRVFVIEERRVVAALRVHGLPSRLDDLLADLDRSLVEEAEAFTRTAAEHGFAAEVEPWPVCLGYTSYLLCAAHEGALEGLTALYAAERAYLDTWTAVGGGRPDDPAPPPRAQPSRLRLPCLDPELERGGVPRLRRRPRP